VQRLNICNSQLATEFPEYHHNCADIRHLFTGLCPQKSSKVGSTVVGSSQSGNELTFEKCGAGYDLAYSLVSNTSFAVSGAGEKGEEDGGDEDGGGEGEGEDGGEKYRAPRALFVQDLPVPKKWCWAPFDGCCARYIYMCMNPTTWDMHM